MAMIMVSCLHDVLAQVQDWDWVENEAGQGSEFALDIASDGAGNSYVLATIGDSTTYQGTYYDTMGSLLAKYSPEGAFLWAGFMPSVQAQTIAINDDRIAIAGMCWGAGSIGGQAFSVNTDYTGLFSVLMDTIGSTIWLAIDSVEGTVEASDIALTANDEVVLTGYLGGMLYHNGNELATTATKNILISKHSSGGALDWVKIVGDETSKSWGKGVCVDGAGSVYVTGKIGCDTCYFDTLVTTRPSYFITRLSATGEFEWVRDGSLAYGTDVEFAAGLGVVSTGYFTSGTSAFGDPAPTSLGTEMFLVNYDPSGNLIWFTRSEALTDSSYCTGERLAVDGQGNIYVGGAARFSIQIGATGSLMGFTGMHLTQYDLLGTPHWSAFMRCTDPTADELLEVTGVACDADNHGYLCGFYRQQSNSPGGYLVYDNDSILCNGGYDFFIARTGTASLGVVSIPEEPPIMLVPNPCSDRLNIYCTQRSWIGSSLTIYSANGSVVQRTSLSGSVSPIDISVMSSGLYTVVFTGAVVHCARFIIER